MARLAKILTRDGRQIPYDPSRVVASILDAIRAAGHHDESLADKLAPMVEFGLTRYYGALPTLDDVAHCIEQSLRSVTDSPAIAEAYLARRRQRERLREVASMGGTTGPVVSTGPSVSGGTTGSLGDWNRGRIEAALVRERDLPLDEARAVAKSVENRILRAGLSHTSTALIRAMVDAELVERGLLTPDSTPSAFILPAFDVQQSIFPLTDSPAAGLCETARALEVRVAGALLQQYSLSTVHTSDVARAHLAGRIDLANLHVPARFATAAMHCGRVMAAGAGLGLLPDFPESCDSANDGAVRIARIAWGIGGTASGAVTLHRLDTALAPMSGSDDPNLVPAMLDRLAAVASAHAAETGLRESPGLWLSFDALAGEAHVPGSLPMLRAVIAWLRDHGGDRGRAMGLRIRLGPATADDRAATVTLEQTVALSLGGHPVVWEIARDSSRGDGLFGEQSDAIPVVSCIPAQGTLNLLAPLPALTSPDIAVSEDRVYASLDEQIGALAKGLAQRTDFLRRFTQRRRDSEPGMATRLALQVLRHAAPTQVALSGLSAAASALAASESPEEISRTAQRLASWLHFRLRDAAKRAGTNIELSGSISGTAASRFHRLSTEGSRDSAGAQQPSSPRHTPGFSLPTSGDRGLEWRLGEEASLHSLASDAVAWLDPSAERLTLAGVVTLLASALESLPIGALQLKVALKRCGACGAANPSDASSCRSCGAASFRAMPVEPGLFEAHA